MIGQPVLTWCRFKDNLGCKMLKYSPKGLNPKLGVAYIFGVKIFIVFSDTNKIQ